jgi:hypothetical protein
MNKHVYSTPETDLLRLSLSINFCESGGLSDYDPLTPPGGGMYDAPGVFDIPDLF